MAGVDIEHSSWRNGIVLDDDDCHVAADPVDEEMSKAALAEIENDEDILISISRSIPQQHSPVSKNEKPFVPIRTSSRSVQEERSEDEVVATPVEEEAKPSHLTMEEIQQMYPDIIKHKIFQLAGDDLAGRPIIAFSMSRLPPRAEIDHDRLLAFMKSLLDQYVESDYTIVYFHTGLNSKNKPALKFLPQIYSDLDRKYKKNLKALYLVHPSNFIKIVMKLLNPLISSKFGKKINYVSRLSELAPHLRLDQLDIPKEVWQHDEKIGLRVSSPTSIFHTKLEDSKTQQFGVPIKELRERSGEPIPIAVRLAIEFITNNALDVEGIFRRSAQANILNEAVNTFNQGLSVEFSEEQVHLAPAILKKFLRDLPEPLLTFGLYEKVMDSCALSEEERLSFTKGMLNEDLPEEHRVILIFLLQFLQLVIDHSSSNRMNSGSLAIVFGPNLLWSRSEASTLTSMSKINSFSKYLIDNSSLIFDESVA